MWLELALKALQQGRIVAVATESYFALAGDAMSPHLLDALIELKGRDAHKGIGLLGSTSRWRDVVAEVSPIAERLAGHFWPGPLTLVLPAASTLSPRVVVDGCVAVRVPGSSPAFELVQAWGGPLTATSANLVGQSPCRTASEVVATFGEHPLLHVVDGVAPGGQVSTLLRLSNSGAEVLRRGAVPEQALTQFLTSHI